MTKMNIANQKKLKVVFNLGIIEAITRKIKAIHCSYYTRFLLVQRLVVSTLYIAFFASATAKKCNMSGVEVCEKIA